MKILRPAITIILSALLVFTAVLAAPPALPAPSAKDKCPVCGMFVAKFPDWTASATFKDGATLFFDGAKDLFTWYHNTKKYTPARNQAAISAIRVKDYYALKTIDARQALFVIGSDVFGPMGKELVAFGIAADAEAFLKDHRGKRILRFDEITPAILKTLE
jgi:nitrous oxide reductase accessory protein NosL